MVGMQIKKHLRQPLTVSHLLTIVFTLVIVLIALLVMGASPFKKPTYVAYAASLSPAPISSQAPQPIVKTTVIPYAPPTPINVPAAASQPQTRGSASSSAGGLVGSIGYAKAGGNCVNQINPRPNGNPITWPARSQTPTIGSAALFSYNHTGRVVGIWSNGDVEVAHENYKGSQTRFPRSALRGFW